MKSVAILGLALALGAGGAQAAAPAPAAPAAAKPKVRPHVPMEQRVDINRASVQQLSRLPGLTEADAKRIVAGRPYATKAALVTAKVLPAGVYHALRDRLIAVPLEPPATLAGSPAPRPAASPSPDAARR